MNSSLTIVRLVRRYRAHNIVNECKTRRGYRAASYFQGIILEPNYTAGVVRWLHVGIL